MRLPRIIQVVGTSGSGKSEAVRRFMKHAVETRPIEIAGRDEPFGYDLIFKDIERVVHIVGSYANPTGGCDTIKDIERLYKHFAEQLDAGKNIVFEGLFIMNQTRGPQFAAKRKERMSVLLLTTPLGVCLESVDARRAARSDGPLENKNNTTNNHTRAKNYAARMRDAGAHVYKVSRDEAVPKILEILHG